MSPLAIFPAPSAFMPQMHPIESYFSAAIKFTTKYPQQFLLSLIFSFLLTTVELLIVLVELINSYFSIVFLVSFIPIQIRIKSQTLTTSLIRTQIMNFNHLLHCFSIEFGTF